MPLRRPRRIFRRSGRSVPPSVRVRLAVGAAVAAGVGLLGIAGLTTDLFGRAPPSAARVSAERDDIAVIDGATLRLRDRVVRLRGVLAPERATSCAGGTDCGAAATAGLAALVRGQRVDCRLDGRDLQGRPWAVCESGGRDLGSAMVGAGWARAEDASLRELEDAARRRKLGLWAERS